MSPAEPIEVAIKQKGFQSEHHKLVVNLIYTYYQLADLQEKIFKKHGLTGQQYNILRILKGRNRKPATIGDLVESMLNKMCDASRLVDKLLVKGLVSRITCPEDRRAVNIQITKMGEELLVRMQPEIDQLHKKMESHITIGEAKELNTTLDKIRDIIKNQ